MCPCRCTSHFSTDDAATIIPREHAPFYIRVPLSAREPGLVHLRYITHRRAGLNPRTLSGRRDCAPRRTALALHPECQWLTRFRSNNANALSRRDSNGPASHRSCARASPPLLRASGPRTSAEGCHHFNGQLSTGPVMSPKLYDASFSRLSYLNPRTMVLK